MPRICAFGCDRSDVPMHRFPDAVKFPEQFQTWVRLVGGRLETLSDYEYYKKKRICDIHFSDSHRNRNNRLSGLAVPTLHLPGQNEDILKPASTSTQNMQPSLSQRDIAGPVVSQVISEPASTFTQNAQPTTIQQHIAEQVVSQDILEPASTSTHAQPTTIQRHIADTSPITASLNRVPLEHNYSAISRPRRTAGKDVAAPLRTKIKYLQAEISRLRKKGLTFKARLQKAEDLSATTLFEHFATNLKKPARLFLKMQLQSSKKPKGRRFTTEEKVLSLSFFKKSPKAYGLLNKLFTLPSTKAMKRLLGTIKLSPGINKIVFEKIKSTLFDKDETDRLCSLMFDEMSLTTQIHYNAQKDEFEGFANNKNNKFADHALVFMVKGIKQNFKQPIAYYFTSGLNKIELKDLIKDVVRHAQDSGLIVLNTVCDQSTVNVGAITDLVNENKAKYLRRGKEWRYDHITINGQKIIPLYDVPHIIKGIRNNLISKDLLYSCNNEEKLVKWEYYQKVYAADKSYGELRLLEKLTEEHINPERINKMRVKSATQLFSHSVAVATEHLSGRGDLPQECKQLIDITLLLDKLFDSLNSNTLHIPNGKIYKGPVRRNSPHHELWKNAKLILKSMKFIGKKITGNKIRLIETTIPSVTNFIKTIEGMEAIWNIVSQRYGFDALLTRHFNQDPVENFFGSIRSHGARNNSPNTVAFEGAFKTLLLNNYNSPHSDRANCEEDSNECLQTLEFFLTEKQEHKLETSDAPNQEEIIIINEDLLSADRETDAGQRNYVCGWVLTKCLKNIVKSCKCCKQNLIDKEDKNSENSFIKAKEYTNKKWLVYPSQELANCFHDLQTMTTVFLNKNISKKNVKKNIMLAADAMVNYPFNCIVHKEKLKEYFINITINVILYSWCRSVNRILSGKISYSGEDVVKTAAQQYYNKYRHCKNKK